VRHAVDQPALAVVELASLARGAVVLDALVKRAPVSIHRAERVSPGKYVIVIGGGVGEVEEAFGAAVQASTGVLVDQLFLSQAHAQIRAGLSGAYPAMAVDSLGLFETYTASAAVKSLDAALKATETSLCGLHLCTGIGGKGYWTLTGALHLVQEAMAVATASVPTERVVTCEVIARPHDEAVEAWLAAFR
jgi:microcompartment protein CcmL/EutN